MFHKTNLGKFGERLTCDIDGYVPEPGDDWRDMRFDFGDADSDDPDEIDYRDNEWWPKVIAEAEAATREANEAAAEWQDNG